MLLQLAHVFRLSGQIGFQVLEDDLCPAEHAFVRGKGHVGSEHRVPGVEQGVVCGDGLEINV